MKEETKKYRIFGIIKFETWVKAGSEEEAKDFASDLEPKALLDNDYDVIIESAEEE
jgi:hypothetical protein